MIFQCIREIVFSKQQWCLFGLSGAIADVVDIIAARGDVLSQVVLNCPAKPDDSKLLKNVKVIELSEFQPKRHFHYNFGFFTPQKRELLQKLESYPLAYHSLIHPSSVLSRFSEMGEGLMIGPQSVITAGSVIGDFVRINRGATVGHDVFIGDHAHIGPRATLCGYVQVGADAFIGAGSVIKDRVKIGRGVTIGAGSVIVNDIPDGCTAFGAPARVRG